MSSSPRCLFPPALAGVFDDIQPYNRGNAFEEDPLWQLNELWTLDKHRAVAVNSNSLDITVPWEETGAQIYTDRFDDRIEVHVPLLPDGKSQLKVEPHVAMKVLFGGYMGQFEVSLPRLREIYSVITNDIIPKFYRFFAYTPAAK